MPPPPRARSYAYENDPANQGQDRAQTSGGKGGARLEDTTPKIVRMSDYRKSGNFSSRFVIFMVFNFSFFCTRILHFQGFNFDSNENYMTMEISRITVL